MGNEGSERTIFGLTGREGEFNGHEPKAVQTALTWVEKEYGKSAGAPVDSETLLDQKVVTHLKEKAVHLKGCPETILEGICRLHKLHMLKGSVGVQAARVIPIILDVLYAKIANAMMV